MPYTHSIIIGLAARVPTPNLQDEMEQRTHAWLACLAALLLGVVWQSREEPPLSSAATVRVVYVATSLERRLAPVVDAFRANFEEGREHGAQLAVYHRGRLVLSLAGGTMDENTRTTVFSSTKVVESLCIALLADRGLLQYDAPVARYWPAFAQRGKGDITVEELMRHQAGLAVLNGTVILDDLSPSRRAQFGRFLAAQAPKGRGPGRQLYHAVTRAAGTRASCCGAWTPRDGRSAASCARRSRCHWAWSGT